MPRERWGWNGTELSTTSICLLDRTGDRRERLTRLLDDLPCVVDNPPAPARLIVRRRHRGDLHTLTTDSGSGFHRRESRRPGLWAWRDPPSAFARPAHAH